MLCMSEFGVATVPARNAVVYELQIDSISIFGLVVSDSVAL